MEKEEEGHNSRKQGRTPSILQISSKRWSNSLSLKRAYRRMAHRDWIGSIILLLWLHARANLVVFEYSSIVRRRACCAPVVIESASSRMTSLCRPSGRVTFFCANDLMRSRTTSMPLLPEQRGQDLVRERGLATGRTARPRR